MITLILQPSNSTESLIFYLTMHALCVQATKAMYIMRLCRLVMLDAYVVFSTDNPII